VGLALGAISAVVSARFIRTLRGLKLVHTLLLIAALLLIECLVGGTRLVFSLPSYAILAGAAVLSVFSIRQPIAKPNLACLGTTAVFFAYILARAARSPVPFLGWMDYYMVLACLVVYLLTALYLTRTRLRTAIIVALLALAVVEIFIGLRQFRYADNWMPFGFIRANYGGRASGTFISSITLAGYLEAVGIFALSLAIWSAWTIWARIALGYIALCCYLGVAITGSRGGYLSSAASLCALAVLTLWLRHRVNPGRFLRSAALAIVLLSCALGGAVLVMQKSALLHSRLDLIGKPDVRWYNWLAALDQFKVSPWFGTGAGTHLYYGRFFRRPPLQYDPEHAHSDYLELLAEYGLIGAAGMAAFLFVHLQSSFSAVGAVLKTARRDPHQPFRDNRLAFQVGALTAVAAYLAHSVTDFNLHIPGHALIFAFIFGLMANPVAENPGPAVPSVGLRFFQWALPALGVWIIVDALPKFRGDYLIEQTRIAVRDRRYQDAIEIGRRALAVETRNPFLYFHLGEANRALGTGMKLRTLRKTYLETAVNYYRGALAIFPQDENFWVRMGQAYDGIGQFRQAETAYATALDLDPNLGVLYAYYAAHLNARGRLDEAREQLEKGHNLARQNLSSIANQTLPSPDTDSSQ
jgi:O-antigen ligase